MATAEQVRGERLGWREAFGFLIGANFMAYPLFIGTAEIFFIVFELFNLLYSGSTLFDVAQICFALIFVIPLTVIAASFTLLFPTIPLGMVALLARHAGQRRTHWPVASLSVCVSALASLALYAVIWGGVSGSDVDSLIAYFLVAALAQGTVLAIAKRMVRRHPA